MTRVRSVVRVARATRAYLVTVCDVTDSGVSTSLRVRDHGEAHAVEVTDDATRELAGLPPLADDPLAALVESI